MDPVGLLVDIPPFLWEQVDKTLRNYFPEHALLYRDMTSQELLTREGELARTYQGYEQNSPEFAVLWSYYFRALTEYDDQQLVAVVLAVPAWRTICKRYRFLLEALKTRNAAKEDSETIVVFIVDVDGTPTRLAVGG